MTVPVAGRGPAVAGVAGFFVALATITVVLRCYCRVIVVKQFGLDDWFTLISWVWLPYFSLHGPLDANECLQILFVFYCTFSIAGTHHGTGQHVTDLPPAEVPIGLKVSLSHPAG